MERILMLRYSEIHLKGLNRPFFERRLMEQINAVLSGLGLCAERKQGRIYVENVSDEQLDKAIARLKKVFGLHSLSVAAVVDKNLEAIYDAACALVKAEVELGKRTFKVVSRRSDKQFPLDSMALNREIGAAVLKGVDGVKVDVHTPDIMLGVEIRERALLYTNEIMCAGGMPTGTNSRAALLLSGGIDSPVAGYMVAKRGVELSAVHFYSFPYTSERAKDKVIALAGLLADYTGSVKLHIVHFTDIQLKIYENCPDTHTTLIMRRLMMRIAQLIAEADGARALITGESIGQVASQTVESLAVTDDAVTMPVFRPCIGMDKGEIMDLARKIGTYETSILPYEDCCTIFVPRHPVTHPKIEDIRQSEALVDFEPLIADALSKTEVIELKREA
jgi:thiamine biosynthesis protein ThiI